MKFSAFFFTLALMTISFNGLQANNLDDFRFVSVLYQGQINGVSFYLTQDGIAFSQMEMRDESMATAGMQITWLGANQDAEVFIVDDQGFQYLLSEGLRSDAQMEKVVYENLYFNIDLVIKQEVVNGAKSLKYEFVVYPGGNPNDIAMGFDQNGKPELLNDGGMIISGNSSNIIATAPVANQQDASGEDVSVSVAADFQVNNGELSVATGTYEQAQVLSISYLQEIWIP